MAHASEMTAEERRAARQAARELSRFERRMRFDNHAAAVARRRRELGTDDVSLASKYGVETSDIERLRYANFFTVDEDGEIIAFMLPEKEDIQEGLDALNAGKVIDFDDLSNDDWYGDEDDEDEGGYEGYPDGQLQAQAQSGIGALMNALRGTSTRRAAGSISAMTAGNHGERIDGSKPDRQYKDHVDDYWRVVDGKRQHVSGYDL